MKTSLRFLILAGFFLTNSLNLSAQNFSLDQIFATPFIGDLDVSPKTQDMVLNINDKGARNLYLLAAPAYLPKKITSFNADEGVEITNVSVSADGNWAVFVRGGDHGSNSAVRPINSFSSPKNGNISVYSVNLKTGVVKLIDEGGFPIIHPNDKQITYLKDGNLKLAAIDGTTKPTSLLEDRGVVRQYQWSADGKKMVFVSRRVSHSFIGIYEQGASKIKWVMPSYHKDDYPTWSADGKKLAFVRQAGDGVGRDSTHIKEESKWQTIVYDLATDTGEEVYKSSTKQRVAAPRDLKWANATNITFSSFEDGWPHLYSINPTTKTSKQLTEGNYTVDNVAFSEDGSKIAFCANFGAAEEDIDRKQLGLIDLASGKVSFLTKGDNVFTKPVFMKSGKSIAVLSSTSTRPILPATIDVSGKSSLKLVSSSLIGDFKFDNLIKPTHVRYKAPDGGQVYAQLFTPKNLKGKAKAIVYIHGGPRRQMYLGWNHLDYYFYDYAFNQYLASQGYVVLSVNYRSGTGYGYDFQNAPRTNRNGNEEYQDILAGGQWLAQQEFVDAEKIGVYGGSYGGYLTAMALAKNSDIFKAGVDIHGMHLRILNPGAPSTLNKTELTALHSSPSFWADNWKSPVLIVHGDDDQNVPFIQSIDLYNRLKARKIDVETLVIPNETHHWMIFDNLMKVKNATFNFLHQRLK
jgi:dipeptidyl aminopeptidase/acylaminoacyl peptidase